LNFQDEDGNTALHYAVECGHRDIVSLLLSQEKVRIDLKNNKGETAKQMSEGNDIQKLFANLSN
jgi:ankyrin repeat protein